MKFPPVNSSSIIVYRLAILVVILCAIGAVPWLVRAQPPSGATITVTNSSNWQIRHLYLSPVDQENWGPDQLNDSVLAPGASFTISVASCSGSEIKVISEDADGCFLSQVVGCTDDAQWTITNAATPNCGN
jgi:hypothetical protein